MRQASILPEATQANRRLRASRSRASLRGAREFSPASRKSKADRRGLPRHASWARRPRLFSGYTPTQSSVRPRGWISQPDRGATARPMSVPGPASLSVSRAQAPGLSPLVPIISSALQGRLYQGLPHGPVGRAEITPYVLGRPWAVRGSPKPLDDDRQ